MADAMKLGLVLLRIVRKVKPRRSFPLLRNASYLFYLYPRPGTPVGSIGESQHVVSLSYCPAVVGGVHNWIVGRHTGYGLPIVTEATDFKESFMDINFDSVLSETNDSGFFFLSEKM